MGLVVELFSPVVGALRLLHCTTMVHCQVAACVQISLGAGPANPLTSLSPSTKDEG